MSKNNAIKAVKNELANKNRSFISHITTALREIGSDEAAYLLI